ncbi:hypothetical protein CHUAL_003020 [Chamberlinius hualienensis]
MRMFVKLSCISVFIFVAFQLTHQYGCVYLPTEPPCNYFCRKLGTVPPHIKTNLTKWNVVRYFQYDNHYNPCPTEAKPRLYPNCRICEHNCADRMRDWEMEFPECQTFLCPSSLVTCIPEKRTTCMDIDSLCEPEPPPLTTTDQPLKSTVIDVYVQQNGTATHKTDESIVTNTDELDEANVTATPANYAVADIGKVLDDNVTVTPANSTVATISKVRDDKVTVTSASSRVADIGELSEDNVTVTPVANKSVAVPSKKRKYILPFILANTPITRITTRSTTIKEIISTKYSIRKLTGITMRRLFRKTIVPNTVFITPNSTLGSTVPGATLGTIKPPLKNIATFYSKINDSSSSQLRSTEISNNGPSMIKSILQNGGEKSKAISWMKLKPFPKYRMRPFNLRRYGFYSRKMNIKNDAAINMSLSDHPRFSIPTEHPLSMFSMKPVLQRVDSVIERNYQIADVDEVKHYTDLLRHTNSEFASDSNFNSVLATNVNPSTTISPPTTRLRLIDKLVRQFLSPLSVNLRKLNIYLEKLKHAFL